MNITEKLKKSWWVLISFVFFINGLGFMHIGFKYNNKNWILEGIAYELPWIFYLFFFQWFGSPIGLNTSGKIVAIAFLLMVVSIIRSIWVAIKLFDVYEYAEPTIKNSYAAHNNATSTKKSDNLSCCVCIFVIFIVFAIIAIL